MMAIKIILTIVPDKIHFMRNLFSDIISRSRKMYLKTK